MVTRFKSLSPAAPLSDQVAQAVSREAKTVRLTQGDTLLWWGALW
ncbi:MAG: hypothetical protein ACK5A0_05865 [Polaromonas sp.]